MARWKIGNWRSNGRPDDIKRMPNITEEEEIARWEAVYGPQKGRIDPNVKISSYVEELEKRFKK